MAPIQLDKAFKKRLAAKPPPQQAAVLECVQRIADTPNHPGLRTHPVHGCPGVSSSRVDRGNRVTWHREGEVIVFRNHCNHDAVYRAP